MNKFNFITTAMAAAFMSSTAWAADIDVVNLPAVSGPNGKIELDAGYINLDSLGSDAVFHGGASFSIPMGDSFGIQADVAATNAYGDTMVGGTMHAFTRDPNSYLLGMAAGAAFSDNANIYYVGPEAELYMGNVSVEAFAGYMNVDLSGVGASDEMFAFGDVGFYATEDFRLTVGASSIAGFESGHIGAEWQMGHALSLTAKASMGEDGFESATAGIKFYFGGEAKSLMRRHREDDPPNRSLDIFQAAGNAFKPPAAGAPAPVVTCSNGEAFVDGIRDPSRDNECLN